MKTMVPLLFVALAASACAGGNRAPAQPAPGDEPTRETAPTTTPAASAGTTTTVTTTPLDVSVAEAAARADSLRESWNAADSLFITDMIHHHAQALVMARMAETHGASASLQTLAARIINSQQDEIRIMQDWLRERGLPVPDPAHMQHGGMHTDMAGMLTPMQLQRLDEARGADFDRLFLRYMIQHHQGALVMVEELFNTPGAAQGDAIFKISADVNVDQETEIDRMRLMLREMLFGTEGR